MVFSVDYRWINKLDGEVQPTYMHNLIEDVFGAIAHIQEHAARYGADPKRIAVTGDSAGGHLSTAAAILSPLIGNAGFGKTSRRLSISANIHTYQNLTKTNLSPGDYYSMKYYLVTWTAEDKNLENFSGNASLEWNGEYPTDDDIIENIKLKDPKLKDLRITLQDKLEFDSQEELDRYGKS